MKNERGRISSKITGGMCEARQHMIGSRNGHFASDVSVQGEHSRVGAGGRWGLGGWGGQWSTTYPEWRCLSVCAMTCFNFIFYT